MDEETIRFFHPELYDKKDLRNFVELIPGRFYFVAYSTNRYRPDTANYTFFRYDDDSITNKPIRNAIPKSSYVYEPLDLGRLAQYVRDLNVKLESCQFSSKAVVHYAYTYDQKRYDDAALLVGAYAVREWKKKKYSLYLSCCPKQIIIRVINLQNMKF